MTSPRTSWLIYALCSLVVLATIGWLLRGSLEADKLRFQAEQGALREQDVRLALWRMDTKLAPLIAEETARPHYAYQPTGNAQSLLAISPYNVLLNFEADQLGNWRSPQAPAAEPLGRENQQDEQQVAQPSEPAQAYGAPEKQLEENRRRLERLSESIDPKKLLAILPEQSNTLASSSNGITSEESNSSGEPFGDEYGGEFGGPYAGEYGGGYGSPAAGDQANAPAQIALPQVASQGKKGDYAQRGLRYQQQARQALLRDRSSKQRGNSYNNVPNAPAFEGQAQQASDDLFGETEVVESISRPLWMNDQLLLARRVTRNGEVFVQGSWLDWTNLKQELLAEVADLFPSADLIPLEDPESGDPSRMLAGLPVEFRVPHLKNIYIPSPGVVRNLAISAIAVLAALVSVGALLWGVLALSERRAAFVSSVTHELRTPLTTFRMYSEMLAGGMVPQEERRQEYLETLRVESERLSHLVENVLSYARLERGREPTLDDSATPGELIERFEKRLADRAKLTDMELVVEIDSQASDVPLQTDLGVVEQILFNLVDNAAKYAAGAKDERIHLLAKAAATKLGRREIAFQVRDHGPGYESERKATRSAAFSKSAHAAAESAPGVGLGLALCRRLAKQLGGKLEVANHPEGGAEATLVLPSKP